jgi:hypothetical protein
MFMTTFGRAEAQGYSNIDLKNGGDNTVSSSRTFTIIKRIFLLLLIALLILWLLLQMKAWPKPSIVIPTTIETPSSRLHRCQGIDWQQACEHLSSAGARRHLHEESIMEEAFLDSDDPSVTYDENCLRVFRLDLAGNTTFPYHANHLLRAGGNQTMALFIQHGAMRDANHYYCSFRKLMLKQPYRPFNDILVIAPSFNYKGDVGILPTDAYWNSSKPWADWRVGAESDPECCGNGKGSHGGTTWSSFDILDNMLGILTNKALFPNMDKISYLGHSAGGQMVQRYALVSELAAQYDADHGEGSIDVEFIVANPSSYAYLNARRYKYHCGHCVCGRENCTCDHECTHQGQASGIPNPRDWVCWDKTYNDWPYGLGTLTDGKRHSIPYVMRAPVNVVSLYKERSVVYMVGQNDTCNDGVLVCRADCWKRQDYLPSEWPCFRNHMDTRCPAMLEGPYRRVRGIQYMKHLEELYGEKTHKLHIIPGVGHDATGMFGSAIGLKELFNEARS